MTECKTMNFKDFDTKSAFIAIVGRPNVGKSSLLNALVGEKVAAVSAKPQTTRTRITGILTKDKTQFVFIDTPGLHKPRTKLADFMVKQVGDSVSDVDLAVLVTEPKGEICAAEKELMQRFKDLHMPAILCVNKIDTLEHKEEMLEKIALFSKEFDFEQVVPISALQNDGIDILVSVLDGYAKPGPHYFADDSLTDQPERAIVAELIRERILVDLENEVPHGVAVSIESMKERKDKDIVDIDAMIYCEKDSHKGIIIGKKGAMLKKIGTEARSSIERFLDCRVNLQCWVKVKEDWRNREGLLRNFGFTEE